MKILRIAIIGLCTLTTTPTIAKTKIVENIRNHQLHDSQPKAKATNVGMASWYGYKSVRKHPKTSNGEPFNQNRMTAAHKTLKFGTKVRVTNVTNNKSVIVTITDRGPFIKGRIIDLTKAAANKIDLVDAGVTKVTLSVL